MPTPTRFAVPSHCKLCGAEGTLALETTIEHGVARPTWCCRACNGEWPLTREELKVTERRHGTSDRRRTTRNDRRQ